MRSRPTKATFALTLMSMLMSFGALAQSSATSDMDILREKLSADKKLIVAANLMLTDAEAQAFWPIYEQYQGELHALNQRLAALILDYADAYNGGTVADAKARELQNEAIAIDEAEVALRKNYAGRLYDAIPTVEAVRYLQIENKIRALIRYDLAAEIPLVE
jgi:Spy/CpxP family protein refolding chaperone